MNGTKQFITNGSIADYLVVICVTNPEAESRLKRFSALLVETNRPGFGGHQDYGKVGHPGFGYSGVKF